MGIFRKNYNVPHIELPSGCQGEAQMVIEGDVSAWGSHQAKVYFACAGINEAELLNVYGSKNGERLSRTQIEQTNRVAAIGIAAICELCPRRDCDDRRDSTSSKVAWLDGYRKKD